MGDDEFDEDDFEVEVEPIPGTVWRGAGNAPLHWTDAPIVAFSLIENLADGFSAAAATVKGPLQAHANHLGVKRQVAQEMRADIEAITGSSHDG